MHTTKSVELDSIDRRILEIVQRNNQLTNLKLAEKAHLSPPTCLRRVRRLRDEGVITGDVALVDPFKVGKSLIVFVEVVLERMHETVLAEFEKRIMSEPEIMQAYPISGDTDYLLVLLVTDMAAYQNFIRRLLVVDKNIKNFRSIFALHRTKFNTEVAVD